MPPSNLDSFPTRRSSDLSLERQALACPVMALVVPPEGSVEHQRIGQSTGFSFLTEDVRSLFEEWSRRGVHFPLPPMERSEEHTSELQSRRDLVCRLLLEK